MSNPTYEDAWMEAKDQYQAELDEFNRNLPADEKLDLQDYLDMK